MTSSRSPIAVDRQRWVDRAIRVSVPARLAAIAAQFATVPLALSAVGSDDFGVWATITSIVGILVFLDFGLGNGAMGRITEAMAHGDDAAVWSIVRHTYLALLGIAAALLFAVGIAASTGWAEQAMTASGSFLGRHTSLLLGFLAVYALVVPASFIQRVFFAFQKAGWAVVSQLVFAVTYLAVVLLAHWLDWTLSALVIGYVSVLLAVYSAFTWFGLRALMPSTRPPWRFDASVIRVLLKDGALFFVLQTTVAIIYNSDQVILSAFVPPDDVAAYAAVAKLFGAIVMANAILLGPLWPAFSDAIAKNDFPWVRSAYRRNLVRSLGVSCAGVALLVLFGNGILGLWTGGVLQVPWQLLLFMGLWTVLEGYGQCMAMLLNAMRVIRFQLAVALGLLVVGLGVKVTLSQNLGIYGPVLGTIAAFVVIVALPETIYIRRLWRRHA